MVIVIDCGNTALSFGLYVQGQRKGFFHTFVDKEKTIDEWENLLDGLFKKHHVQDYEAILLSSVVPSLNPSIIQAIQNLTQKKVIVLSKGFKTGIQIKIDNPSELGTDLVADAVGAMHQYGVPCVIADLGTATKFIGIDKQGALIGVTIMPGVLISLKALIGKAAQLMDISLQQPKKILGKNPFPTISTKEDYVLWLHLSKKFKILGLSLYLTSWRKVRGSLSGNFLLKIKNAFIVYNKYEKFNFISTIYIDLI
jgi:type III pantothenate kinase